MVVPLADIPRAEPGDIGECRITTLCDRRDRRQCGRPRCAPVVEGVCRLCGTSGALVSGSATAQSSDFPKVSVWLSHGAA